ncbi:hypothetical protein [Halobacteriovorax sp. JY17]|uniref:hypothetical protein n=1 Tax=Halobacteriovorax sp. JY17 TaxID=2014617 RepID=UPI000C443116|nr:hypothetical protein [Halobacteriovorax sp. JY17]PIK16202.1 MAG: hypothetical protein CES88_05560 [Halobacteriovorax sp. JY17]
MNTAPIFQIQSILILSLMILGIYLRRKRKTHVKIMSAVIIWDILLILQIELTRSAIAKAVQVMTNPWMLKVHLFFAIGSVVLYILMIITGRKLLSGDIKIRPKHKTLGWTTLVFRILTLVTSYWAVSR